MNLFLTIVNVALAGIVAFLPSTGKVYDNSTKFKGLERLRPRGWLTLNIFFIFLGFTAYQYWFNDKTAKEKENQAKEEQRIRDSTQKKESDLRALNIVSTMTRALAEYGFKADSTNKKLVKIVRDSSKTKVVVGDYPVVKICEIGVLKSPQLNADSIRYGLRICSDDAGSADFDMSCRVALLDTSNSLKYLGELELLSKASRMSKGGKVEQKFTIYDVRRFKSFYIYVEGTYKNLDGTKTFPIDVIYSYNIQENEFLGELAKYEKELIKKKFFRSK